MDTNTIMLIALAIIIVLAAVVIWLANRGTGVEEPHHETDLETDEELSEGHSTTTAPPAKASTTKVTDSKVVDSKVAPDTKVTGNKAASDVRVVDNTKKTSATNPSADLKDSKNVKEGRDTKNPPKKS